ncbi:MAG TPA: cob(I)yrinic acid a,c-diamide adenosyltransferase [Firmicutes bacterium]|nr:cob(I)yrinic acid a,c-diamide adenosyltransferase [Bacillota bacterium]
MNKGFVQVYTGDGKGKTTAALGLGLRAVGRGYNVIMFQFLKGFESGELKSVLCLKGKFKIIRLAETKKFFFNLDQKEKEALKKKVGAELRQVYEVMENHACDVLILDEIMAALHGGLLTVEEVCKLIESRPPGMELILTGRSAPDEILERADLVTEMRCVKHYIDQGVMARVGIEM